MTGFMKSANSKCGLRLSRLFTDGMVLQRSERTRVWGWGLQQDEITVTLFCADTALAYDTTIVQETGYWEVFLNLDKAGSGYEMQIRSESGECWRIQQVSVGEVWLCSGQSNMELPMSRLADQYPEELCDAADTELKIFQIQEHPEFDSPLEETESGEWKESSEENVLDFSGVTWFYGRFLRRALGVPVGLINASLGGSPIEAWMSKEALGEDAKLQEILHQCAAEGFAEQKQQKNEAESKAWYDIIRRTDQGLLAHWEIQSDDCHWKKITLPGSLSERGIKDFIGVIWLRRRFVIPENLAAKPAKIWLGTLTDSDETYLNGVLVGSTGYQYPPRKYEVPAGILRAGENIITVRLTCNNGNGRMTPGKPCKIMVEQVSVELGGTWEYRIGTSVKEPAPEADFVSWKPCGLYQGMLAPCRRYTIKGFVWYQGESNDKQPQTYEHRLKGLIADWREQWHQGEIPFLVAQLPGFAVDLPADSGWPLLREAQRRAGQLSNTAVTVNLDLGEWNDLHPLKKREVAYRLSLAARSLAYQETVSWQGPVAVRCISEGMGMRIFFAETGTELLTVDGKPPQEFEAAGTDGRYFPVEAKIEGSSVLLTGRYFEPLYKVRYAWTNCPDRGLLCNAAGLLASPFEMDIERMD